jgi:hypothetical protein
MWGQMGGKKGSKRRMKIMGKRARRRVATHAARSAGPKTIGLIFSGETSNGPECSRPIDTIKEKFALDAALQLTSGRSILHL